MAKFRALLVEKTTDGQTIDLREMDEADLPEGDVLIDVDYSTINYKDALTVSGKRSTVRSYPMVPGIDLAGTVRQSASQTWQAGDKVVLNGWRVGESHWGGYAGVARLKSEWLVPLPDVFTTHQAMAIGTAGYTAALSVDALVAAGVRPDDGEIVVTGATGGVGSIAIVLLHKAGYRVAAVTGKAAEHAYLRKLGAQTIVDRAILSEPGQSLQTERWAGGIDAVGSQILANVCAQLRYGGAVTACGLAHGPDLPLTMAPFILRGVSLLGIESVEAPYARRHAAWGRLARDLDPSLLDLMVDDVGLADVIPMSAELVAGKVRGRIVVDVRR